MGVEGVREGGQRGEIWAFLRPICNLHCTFLAAGCLDSIGSISLIPSSYSVLRSVLLSVSRLSAPTTTPLPPRSPIPLNPPFPLFVFCHSVCHPPPSLLGSIYPVCVDSFSVLFLRLSPSLPHTFVACSRSAIRSAFSPVYFCVDPSSLKLFTHLHLHPHPPLPTICFPMSSHFCLTVCPGRHRDRQRRKAGWTTSKSGHLCPCQNCSKSPRQKRLEEEFC